MKCGDCGKSNAQWVCPECRCYACDHCRDIMQGQCTYCAPYFKKVEKKIKNKKRKAK